MTGWRRDRMIDLQNLLEALREHIDEGRLTAGLCALVYFYAGRVALRGNRVRNALSALEQARRLSRRRSGDHEPDLSGDWRSAGRAHFARSASDAR